MYDEYEKNPQPDISSSHRKQELFKHPSTFATEADIILLQDKIKDYKTYSSFYAKLDSIEDE